MVVHTLQCCVQCLILWPVGGSVGCNALACKVQVRKAYADHAPQFSTCWSFGQCKGAERSVSSAVDVPNMAPSSVMHTFNDNHACSHQCCLAWRSMQSLLRGCMMQINDTCHTPPQGKGLSCWDHALRRPHVKVSCHTNTSEEQQGCQQNTHAQQRVKQGAARAALRAAGSSTQHRGCSL